MTLPQVVSPTGLSFFPLDGIHIISISELGLDSEGATRLETADGSGLRSGFFVYCTCIRELHSGRMALLCVLGFHPSGGSSVGDVDARWKPQALHVMDGHSI